MTENKHSICLVTDDFVPASTGVGFHAQQVGQELARRGHRVSVITTRRRGEPDRDTWNGITVHRTFSIRQYGFHLALPGRRTIRNILDRERPDVIHYHWIGLLALRTRAVAASRAVRHVLTCHMTVDHIAQPWFTKPFRGLIARLYARFCNRMDAIMVPSANMIEPIRQLGVHTPVRYVSNPVSFAGAEPAPTAGVGRFKLLYVGQLNPLKNLPFLLRGFRQLRDTGRVDAELCIVGDGNLRSSLEQTARDLGIAGRVRFTGFVNHDDLPGFYAGADAFVLPSLVEVQPMVAMEAMRFGKPVLITESIVSARELVDHGRNGFVVRAGDTDDLARSLETLARDPDLRLRMGRESFAKSAAYGLEGVVTGIEEVYSRTRRARGATHDSRNAGSALTDRAAPWRPPMKGSETMKTCLPSRSQTLILAGISLAFLAFFEVLMWAKRPPEVRACNVARPEQWANAKAIPAPESSRLTRAAGAPLAGEPYAKSEYGRP